MLEISKMLTISTAHITKETAKRLESNSDDNNLGLTVYTKSDFGFFIYFDDKYTSLSLPDDLYKCIALASELKCDILCLDCDGEEIELLDTYDW